MCGINGIVSGMDAGKMKESIRTMNRSLAHRGPDDEGEAYFEDKGRQIALGHRRLSIIDLSSAGHQPMRSNDGRLTIIINGELYNYKALKLDLSRAISGSGAVPYDFKTNSDTEVVLAAWITWGIRCLERFEGMFAFALWDNVDKKLFLARDRFGKKPLYVSTSGNNIVFSSEIRALLASGLVKPKLNLNALGDYFRYQTVHAPATILENVRMVRGGTCIEYFGETSKEHHYWNIGDCVGKNAEHVGSDPGKANKKIRDLLFSAVEKRLISDVPLGAFLSGGIDSSAIVGVMSKVSTAKVKTFSVIFEEKEFSEEKYSSLIAKKFNTDHHRILLKPEDLLNSLPDVLAAMDHPGGDGPNSYVVSRATKQAGITVALSGLGGDELFGGYPQFKRIVALRKKNWITALPLFTRKLAGSFYHTLKNDIGSEKAQELLAVGSFQFKDTYPVQRLTLTNKTTASLLKKECAAGNDIELMTAGLSNIGKEYLVSTISIAEMQSYMHDVLLRDTDNMSMAHALEIRAPFLDHTLVEYVLSLGDEHKDLSRNKALLTDALADILPPDIINRPKMGFTFPWKHWMKKELRELCETRLDALSKRSFIGEMTPGMLWKDFLKDDKRITWSRLWHLVVLEDWLQRNDINE